MFSWLWFPRCGNWLSLLFCLLNHNFTTCFLYLYHSLLSHPHRLYFFIIIIIFSTHKITVHLLYVSNLYSQFFSFPIVVVVSSLSHVQLLVTPWTVTYPAPLSMGFPRQIYQRGLPFPSPGDLEGHRDQTCISCIARQTFYHWATREAFDIDQSKRFVHWHWFMHSTWE